HLDYSKDPTIGSITVRNATKEVAISLGAETLGSLSLMNDEVNHLIAGAVRIGRDDAFASNSITFYSLVVVASEKAPTLHLITAKDVLANGSNGAIHVDNLAITAGGTIELPNSNDARLNF